MNNPTKKTGSGFETLGLRFGASGLEYRETERFEAKKLEGGGSIGKRRAPRGVCPGPRLNRVWGLRV